EDGILDRYVTGVQTCALPIWRQTCVVGQKDQRLAGFGFLESDAPEIVGIAAPRIIPIERDTLVANQTGRSIHRRGAHAAGVEVRSEERRVGKESERRCVQSWQ